MTNALIQKVTTEATSGTMTLSQAERIAHHFQKSGYFADARDISKAVTKILFGASLGLDPMASMSQIILVQGKPSMSAHLMGRLIKASGKYRFTLDELTAERCTITLYEKVETSPSSWEWFKHSPFTCLSADFKHLQNSTTWRQYPKNMLYARTMSNLTKMLCPEVLGGSVYLPDELPGGSEINPETLEPLSVDTALPDNASVIETTFEPVTAPSAPPSSDTPDVAVPTDPEISKLYLRLKKLNLSESWVSRTLHLPARFRWDHLTSLQQDALDRALTLYEQLHTGTP